MSTVVSSDLRARVESLYYDYAEAIDEDLARWPDFFTDDAVYKVVPRENYAQGLQLASVLCEGRGMILDRAMAVARTIVHHPRVMRHFISNVRVAPTEDALLARANFAIYETFEQSVTRLFVVGRYIDRLVETERGLRFSEKLCVFDGDLVQGSLVYPL